MTKQDFVRSQRRTQVDQGISYSLRKRMNDGDDRSPRVLLGSMERVNRNAQFEHIAELKDLYHTEGNPIISVDTKKKELIGNLYREGKIYTTETIEVFDHDFSSLAEGVAVPHSIYDQSRNEVYVNIGTSCDASEFSCDSLRH